MGLAMGQHRNMSTRTIVTDAAPTASPYLEQTACTDARWLGRAPSPTRMNNAHELPPVDRSSMLHCPSATLRDAYHAK